MGTGVVLRTLAFGNTENGSRKSWFSGVRSYPQQKTHHAFSQCQKPEKSQVLCDHQNLASQHGSQSCLGKCFENEMLH